MSKMSELSMMLDDLIACGTKLAETARALKDFYSSDEQEQPAPDKKTSGKKASKKQESPAQTPNPAPQPESAKEYSKEDVRRILAAKANEAEGIYSPGQGTGPEIRKRRQPYRRKAGGLCRTCTGSGGNRTCLINTPFSLHHPATAG